MGETRRLEAAKLPLGSCAGICVDGLSVLVVHAIGGVCAFENKCPHLGVPLNGQGPRVLEEENRYVVCTLHGAVFDPETGLCLGGPCRGKSLTMCEVAAEDGDLTIKRREA